MTSESMHIILNGETYSANEPIFNTKNRAFCYGDAIFETMHAYGTDTQFLPDHIERLHKGMATLKMQIPENLEHSAIDKQIKRLLNRDKLFGGTRIRLTVFRNNGGFYTPQTNEVSYIIECSALDHDKYNLNPKGLVVDIFQDIKKPVNIISPYKTANSIIFVMSGLYKKESNIDECLILNEKGQIIESISSNIFVVKNDCLLTPPVEQGCVDGIMRKNILKIAKQSGIPVQTNVAITENNLPLADEVFLTNAIHGIQWVVGFRQRRFYNKIARLIADELNKTAFS